MIRGPSTPCGDVRAELAGDSDLTIMRPCTRPNGEPCEVEVRWVIHHMLEHFGTDASAKAPPRRRASGILLVKVDSVLPQRPSQPLPELPAAII